MQRTLVKMVMNDDYVNFRTFSRTFTSPHRFYVSKEEFKKLLEKKFVIVSDINSFAKLRLEEDVLDITFYWIRESNMDLTGKKDEVRIPFEKIRDFIENGVSRETNVLSLPDNHMPTITFMSNKNLKEVAATPVLRHKLGKFMTKNFRWPREEQIEIFDDYDPYNFFFKCTSGLCGGIILHQQDGDLRKSKYQMHT